MYVCLCNVLTDRDVTAALDAGSRSVDDVYRFHGVEPECGKCMATIQAMLGGASVDDVSAEFFPDSLAAE